MSFSIWLRYLLWMLATLVGTIAACAAFNVFIDPLGIFGSPRIPGLNAAKPDLDHHRDLARWQSARHICPTAGIFGNSRAEIGFDPEHAAFHRQRIEAFNHAIPGTSITTSLDQLNWLRAAGCAPKVVILGVEFFDFLGAPRGRALPVPETDVPPRLDSTTIAETVFSLTALRDSINTILIQRAPHAATITPRGFNPLNQYIPEVAHGGHYTLFRQRAEENLRNWMRKPRRIHPDDGGLSSDYAGLRAFLATVTKSADAVYVVIYPYHAEIRLMMERAGLGGLFAEWKRSIFDETRALAKSGINLQVWDFSGLSPETLEEIPPRGDRSTHLRYYWEAGHFKKELGSLMLDRMLDGNGSFGTLLTADTLDRWLSADRESVKAELANSSPLVDEIHSLFGDNVSPVNRNRD